MPTTPTKAQLRALPKKQRREVARQVAREQRLVEAKRARRRRVVLRTSAVVAGVAVLTGGVLGTRAWVHGLNRGPLNMISDGIVMSGYQGQTYAYPTGAVQQGGTPTDTNPSRKLGITDAVMYVDYADPAAATLWTTAGAPLTKAMLAETLTIEVHPIAPGGSAASVAAASALACVAEHVPDKALVAHQALLTGGQDWTRASAAAAIAKAGIRDTSVATCIKAGKFSGWVKEATDRAAAKVPFDVGAVTGTTLLLAGTAYDGKPDDAGAFGTALLAAQDAVAKENAAAQAAAGTGDGTGDGSASPSPSASPSDGASPSASASESASPSPSASESSKG